MTANQEAIESWNGESGRRWAADADDRDRVLAAVGDLLLGRAALRPGEEVLDLGCGCGATTLAAARAVAPGGRALGVDVSAPMLEVARSRAGGGVSNTTFRLADVQVDDLPGAGFDVAISRFGTMFFDDPVAAFANVAGALRPGGRLCVVTWQPLVANEWLALPGAELLRFGTVPDTDPGAPGMFAQSDPARVHELLAAAGFVDVAVEPVTVALRLGDDPEAATKHLAGTGVGRAVLETVPDHDVPAALDAVRAVLAGHSSDAGVHLDGAVLVTTARR